MKRRLKYSSDYYYHIYNRGVDKRRVFLDKWDYVRFLESLRYFNRDEPIGSLYYCKKYERSPTPSKELDSLLVDIIAYCLNPNHFHLLLKQRTENGISKFIHKLSTGYTNHFNEKYERSGSLFQGKFKSTEIRSMNGLLKMSIYVNCNAEIHGIAKKEEWIWSSYLDYIGVRSGTLCNKQTVLNEFKDVEEYIEVCKDLIPQIREVKDLEEFGLE